MNVRQGGWTFSSLPATLGYYTYLGSVTASPCTEGIAWYILKTPREVSAAQIKAFAKLYSHDVRAVTAAQWPHRQRIPVIADP